MSLDLIKADCRFLFLFRMLQWQWVCMFLYLHYGDVCVDDAGVICLFTLVGWLGGDNTLSELMDMSSGRA